MSTESVSRNTDHLQRISGPGELVQAVPYLLGFHPSQSLVLIGLCSGRLVVTARLDLVDADEDGPLVDTLASIRAAGVKEIVAVVYDEDVHIDPDAIGADLPWCALARQVGQHLDAMDFVCVDALLVSGGRWWTYTCSDTSCCPPDGRSLPASPSTFAVAATYAGVSVLPDREALADQLAPSSALDSGRVSALIEGVENDTVAAVLTGQGVRAARSVKRAVFAAARAASEASWIEPDDADIARFGAALGEIALRDALWMAIDNGRLDGRPLWRSLARRLPAPYDASALFLFGWATWRAGDGALAAIAAQRAVTSDPAYSAADLLLAALSHGIDPRRLPRLRMPRPA